MPNKRTYTDDQLRQAIAVGTNWSNVMVALGKTPGSGATAVKAVAERLGLDTSHFAHRQSFKPVAAAPTLFSNPPKGGGRRGLSIGARWFLDRGYTVSVPLEPAAYDPVTESDDGLQRVQVKSTTCQERNGRYAASVSHMRCGSPTRNANGNRRKGAVPEGRGRLVLHRHACRELPDPSRRHRRPAVDRSRREVRSIRCLVLVA